MSKAVDISNYSGELNASQAQRLVELGYTTAIVQVVNEDIHLHRQQIPILQAAGIDVQGYVYMWFDGDFESRVAYACRELQNYNITKLWLDCEDQAYANGENPQHVIRAIRRSSWVATIAGVTSGIYTGKWWWEVATGDTKEFSDLPLWAAVYGGNPDITSFVPFGGWTSLAIKQHTPDTTIALIPNVDLNTVREVVKQINLRDALQDEEILIAKVLAIRAADLITGANSTIGAKIVEGSRPTQVVFTITDQMFEGVR